MKFIQKLNPFYWRRQAKQWQLDYEKSEEGFNHLQDEIVELKKQNAVLVEQYDYPKFEALAGEFSIGSDPALRWLDGGEPPRQYSPIERKLLLDMAMLKQQSDYYETLFAKLDEAVGGNLEGKINSLTLRAEEAEALFQEYKEKHRQVEKDLHEKRLDVMAKNKEIRELQEQIEALNKQLEEAKRKNEKWFEVVLGYGGNAMTLLNRQLWGSKIGSVGFDNATNNP